MTEIIPGLLVGDTKSAHDRGLLGSIHLVITAARDHPIDISTAARYIYLPLLDDETDNVLQYLDNCYDEISSALKKSERVLVHCVNGVSRSVAVTTGFIMKLNSWDFIAAYAFVSSIYPAANMADNFRAQLTEYGTIFQWNMTGSSLEHRMYRMRCRIDRPSGGVSGSVPLSENRYQCRKCRESLFLDYNVIQGLPDVLRVECMQWMGNTVDASHTGDLACPRCSTKLGRFSWGGIGDDLHNPGFLITRSKVDQMPWSASFKGDSVPPTRF